MTWIAPDVQRIEPGEPAPERDALQRWLDYHRATLLFKCQGLTGEQLVRRTAEPSTLSLLGLVAYFLLLLFIAMARNATSPIDHFGLPVDKTVIVSCHVAV